ncbi:MAG: hypothetical protein KGZ58_11450 [Ignavibacteriales bacterium]|nr:hypothetical protein [Ignavibacteriales bacterium]
MSNIQKYNSSLTKYDDESKGFFATIFSRISSWWNNFTGRTSSEQAVISVAQLRNELRDLFDNDGVLFKAFEKYNQEIELLKMDIQKIKEYLKKQHKEKVDTNKIYEMEQKVADISRKIENKINPSDIELKKLVENQLVELTNLLQTDIQKHFNRSQNEIHKIESDFRVENEKFEKKIEEAKRLVEYLHKNFENQTRELTENASNLQEKVNSLAKQVKTTDDWLKKEIENNKKENEGHLDSIKYQVAESFRLLLTKMQEYDYQQQLITFSSLTGIMLVNLIIFYFEILNSVLKNFLILNSTLLIILLIIIRLKHRKMHNDK